MAKTTKTTKSTPPGATRAPKAAEGDWDGQSKVFIKRLLRTDQIGNAGISFMGGEAPAEAGLGMTSAAVPADQAPTAPSSVLAAGPTEPVIPAPQEPAIAAAPEIPPAPVPAPAAAKPAKQAPKRTPPATRKKAPAAGKGATAKRAAPASPPKKRPAANAPASKRARPKPAEAGAPPEMATILREPEPVADTVARGWPEAAPAAAAPEAWVPPAVHYAPKRPPSRARRALRFTVLAAALVLAGIVGGGLLAVSWAPFGDSARFVTETFAWISDVLERSPPSRAPDSTAATASSTSAPPAPRASVDPPVPTPAPMPPARPQFEAMLAPAATPAAAPPPPPAARPSEAPPKFAPIAAEPERNAPPAQAQPAPAPPAPQPQPSASQPLYPWGTVPYYGRPGGY